MSLPVIQSWLELHSHAPWLQAVLIVLATFVLEDAATVLAAMNVQVGHVTLAVALGALYAGIVLGDMGLYGLGRLAAMVPWAARLVPPERLRRGAAMLDPHVVKVVFVSRFLPGARLPTYTACGYFGVDFKRFTLAAIGATLIWTSLLFGRVAACGASDHRASGRLALGRGRGICADGAAGGAARGADAGGAVDPVRVAGGARRADR